MHENALKRRYLLLGKLHNASDLFVNHNQNARNISVTDLDSVCRYRIRVDNIEFGQFTVIFTLITFSLISCC